MKPHKIAMVVAALAGMAAVFDAAAADAYRVDATLTHGGARFAAPATVVMAGTPATVQVDGKDGYRLSLAVEPAAGGKLKLSAALASGYGEMSPVLVVTPGEPATVAVGDLAMSVTVTPAPGRAAADAPPASAITL